ncbi:class I SAM-dependent methyltransferase [Agrobacterium tumefaciens]|uniref:Methyltransferase domain-containing protein n=1 Tax=Agrobacterium tumefaciens TaxID=358 RepID=A0A176XHI0_AGRTU|nr:class I SAM-dependent methyltransferase [Agrobacterium tumefaciens]OAE48374.1 hypothetical protein A7J57_22075 [Agrobacterium tumefaciens]
MPESIIQQVQELAKSARMLALIGASIKLQFRDSCADDIHKQIDLGARMAVGSTIDFIDSEQSNLALTMIGMALSEANELFQRPDRGSNWEIADRDAMQAIGRASESAFSRIRSLAEADTQMRQTLSGTFLDVGTGVGGIALEAARTCPELVVEGIDIWEPALEIARENIAQSEFKDRVTIRHLDVSDLDEHNKYSLAWLPTMFLRRETVEAAIDCIARASTKSAYLIAGLYTVPDDPFLALMANLRTLRSGGEITESSDIRKMMEARGYVDVQSSETPVATFVFGRLA